MMVQYRLDSLSSDYSSGHEAFRGLRKDIYITNLLNVLSVPS